MASKPPALQPIRQGTPGDDFDEDTLLPPPAPGLVLPSADHGFDPPTFPGLGAPLRTGPHAARIAESATSGAKPMSSLSQLAPAARMPAAKISDSQPNASVPSVVEHAAAPRELYADPDPTPRTSTLTSDLAARTGDALPPLPRVPKSGTATAMLAYLGRVTLNRWQRRRIAARLEEGLRSEAEMLDRLLADLGQHAYIEQVDLLALYPAPIGDEAPARVPVSQTPAESWAVRIDAEQLRTLALLTREESRLTAELLQCVEVRRRDDRLTQDPALHEAFELLLGRLAAVRVERWVKERARGHCQRQQAQLLSTLEQLLAQWALHSSQSPHSAMRRVPNLLLLGSLVASQRMVSSTRAIEPWFSTIPGRPAGIELSPSLFQPLWRFQDTLLPRAVLSARALVERYAYDEEMVDRALMLVSVVAITALVVFAIAWWAMTPSDGN